MDNNKSILRNPLFIFVGAFLVTVLIVFFGITRWLWPVEWTDAAPRHLATDSQEEYLRMAIDSYAVNQDVNLATRRYADLGTYGAETLATIQENPGDQEPANILAFAAAVDAQGEIPEAPGYPINNSWRVFGWLFGLLFVIFLGYLIYQLWQDRQAAERQAELEPRAITPVEEVETTVSTTWEPETTAESLQDPSSDIGLLDENESAIELADSEEEEKEEVGGTGAAALGAASMGAAVLAAATLGDEEVSDTEAEVEPDETLETTDDFALPDWLAEFDEGADEIPLETESDQTSISPSSTIHPEEMAKFHNPMEYIEGIGPAYAAQLAQIELNHPIDLLERGASPSGRQQIAEETGISPKLILRWVNQVDLYRIKGVGSEYAELLEAAGVDTVVELAQRNPGNLYERILSINEEKNLVRRPPTAEMVADWVSQAKDLPRVVKY